LNFASELIIEKSSAGLELIQARFLAERMAKISVAQYKKSTTYGESALLGTKCSFFMIQN
jgi:hypothetical protein